MTTCLEEPNLQGYLEESGSSSLRRLAEGHMVSCARCRATFERVAATNRRVNRWLAALGSPAEEIPVDRQQALAGVLWRVEIAGVETPWYRRGANPGAMASSLAIQCGIVAALMTLGAGAVVRGPDARIILLAPPPVVRSAEPKHRVSSGGGGQGLPLTRAQTQPVRSAPKVFSAMPVSNSRPALTLDTSLIAAADLWSPAAGIGNPLSILGNGGPGGKGGQGSGPNGGPGPGDGDGSRIFTSGNGVTAPSVLSRVDPEYSDEARQARYGGSVQLSFVVGLDGRAESIQVVRGLGMGLDEKAVGALQQWRFKPGTNKGVPVRVRAQIEVMFRLL